MKIEYRPIKDNPKFKPVFQATPTPLKKPKLNLIMPRKPRNDYMRSWKND